MKTIQEQNREFIIMANNPEAKTYEEALEMELGFGCKVIDLKHQFFGKNDPTEMTLVYDDFDYDNYAYFLHYRGNPTICCTKKDILNKDNYEILGKPLTLNRVLIALEGWICDESIYMKELTILRFERVNWDLTKETLEEQSEEVQIAINEMIK